MTEPNLSRTSEATVADIARKHGFSTDAAYVMAAAVSAGSGSMAQFNHPEFGGMGQWSRGGMLMIGDMFNNGLKARVGALVDDLAGALGSGMVTLPTKGSGEGDAGGDWWPSELGRPTASGSQNGDAYAVFANLRRLAVRQGRRITVRDTGEHHIGGVSQKQGSGSDLSFSSQLGTVRLGDLPEVKMEGEAARPDETPVRRAKPSGDVLETIRKLADLRDQGVLTEAEFAAKKQMLLDRL